MVKVSFTRRRSRAGRSRSGVLLLLAAITVAAFLSAHPLYADPAATENPATEAFADGPSPLREITLEGLRRTRESVVLDLIPVESGDTISPETVLVVEEEIIDSDLFSEVVVIPHRPADNPDVIDLRITVREKWTLIPIPFFFTDGARFSGGLVLIESNLLGRNLQLLGGAFGGNDGFSGFFVLADPSIRGTSWSGRMSASTGTADETHELPDGTELRSFTIDETSVGAGTGYRFTRDFRGSLGARVSLRGFAEEDPALGEDGVFFSPDLSLRYDASRPEGVLRLGPDVGIHTRAVIDTNRGINDDTGWEVTGRAGYSLPLVPSIGGRIRLLISGGYGELAPPDKQGISGRDGYRTLPVGTTVADEWATSAVFADIPVFEPSWGALVLSHYWEAGVFDDPAHDTQFFGGPGAAFRVYIREVAIPALGIDLAYNLVDPGLVFSFALGAQM